MKEEHDMKPESTPTDELPEATPTDATMKPESKVSLCIVVVIPANLCGVSVVLTPPKLSYLQADDAKETDTDKRDAHVTRATKVCVSIQFLLWWGLSGAVMNLLHVLKTADLAHLKLWTWDSLSLLFIAHFTFTMKLSYRQRMTMTMMSLLV